MFIRATVLTLHSRYWSLRNGTKHSGQWLMCWTLDRTDRVRALTEVLFGKALELLQSLSPLTAVGLEYNWVLANRHLTISLSIF